MRPLSLLITLVALSGCKILAERAPDYATHALDSTANRTTDVALDSAESAARSSGNKSDREEPKPAEPEKITRKVEDNDVLIKQGDDYLIGKQLGAQVLVIKTGQKVDAAGAEVIPVRPAKKRDLKVGTDVYFTTSRGDVRRAAWTAGPVTDDGALGDGKVAVGPESDLDWDGQVAVKR